MNAPISLALGVAAALALCASTVARSDEAAPITVLAADALDWGPAPPALPDGARLAVLSGDPGAAEPFVLRLAFPAGYEFPAHTHPVDETATVISGRLELGRGRRLDRDATTSLAAGGFVDIPAGEPHFVWTAVDTVVQIHGTGPFELHYVEPGLDRAAR